MNPKQKIDNSVSPIGETGSQITNQPVIVNKSSSKKKWRKILINLSFLIGVPLLISLLVAISFVGNINLKPDPNPTGKKLTMERNAAQEAIQNKFTEVEKIAYYQHYDTSTADYCFKGRNDQKSKDEFEYRCEYRVTKFYGFNSDFLQEILRLEQDLVRLGWRIVGHAEDNTDQLQGVNQLDYYHAVNNGKEPLPYGYPDGYFVSYLGWSYTKDTIYLDLAFTERDSVDHSSIDRVQIGIGSSLEAYQNTDLRDSKTLVPKITKDNKYVIAISIGEEYFRN